MSEILEEIGKITRVEVIDESGRAYVGWDKAIQISIQDEGRTLKIFVESK